MTRELAYQAAVAFLLTVALGLAVLMWREHRPAEVVVDATPAKSAPVCVPPMSHWQFKQGRIA